MACFSQILVLGSVPCPGWKTLHWSSHHEFPCSGGYCDAVMMNEACKCLQKITFSLRCNLDLCSRKTLIWYFNKSSTAWIYDVDPPECFHGQSYFFYFFLCSMTFLPLPATHNARNVLEDILNYRENGELRRLCSMGGNHSVYRSTLLDSVLY